MGRALAPFRLLFLEEPVAPEFWADYPRIRDACGLPIAAGERVATIFGMRPLIEGGALDIVQPDTGRFGGLSQMRKLAAMAEARNIMVAPHSGTLGPVAEFAALHLLAAIPNALMLERLEEDWEGRGRVVSAQPVIRDGHALVPDAPGLGVDIVEEEIARHPSERNVAVPGGAGNRNYEPGTQASFVYTQPRFRRAQAFGEE
jgi:galactonate dehydratase